MKTMRVVTVVMSMAMMVAAGAAQTSTPKSVAAKDDLFAGTEVFAKNATDVTEITMDPDTLGMVGGRARTMILNVVRTYEYDKPGMYRIEDVEAFRNKLNTGDWHCSVHTRSLKTGESTDVCNKRRTDDLTEQAIITVEPKQLTFIHTIRKGYSGQHSELDGMWLEGGTGFPALAMINPSITMDLQGLNMQLHGLTMFPKGFNSFKAYPKIDRDQLDKSMKDAQKKLDEAGKELQKLNSPEFKQKLKDAEKKNKDSVVIDIE